MRRIRLLLALHFGAGASTRTIGRELGIAPSTVREYLARATAAGVGWPLAADVTDESLVARLFVNAGVRAGARHHAEPDWPAVARELKRPGVNLQILWDEYRAIHPGGYAYSRFCQLFREFERRLSPTMRQQHVAGQKAFVDYSGKRVPIADPLTGEVRMAEIFVAVLGASSLTYAEASWTQTLPDWIEAHVRMFRFFGAAPRLLVPDNLKSGIHKPSFYDPEVNRSYAMMAAHYDVGVLPARPRRPRDKAAVEAGVRFAQSYILGRLRNVTFFSLAECNAAIAAALERMNGREMRRLGMSRRQLFDAVERPAMRALPEQDYEYAEWRLARVGIDYHVEVQGFFYSVPHELIREQVDTRATTRTRSARCPTPPSPRSSDTGSTGRRRRKPRTARLCCTPTSAAPAITIRRRPCSRIRRWTCCTTLDCTAWPRGSATWRTIRRARRSATPSGWASCSSGRARCASRSASRPGRRPPSCATWRPWRTWTTGPRAASTARCSSSLPAATGSASDGTVC
jgi:transposase